MSNTAHARTQAIAIEYVRSLETKLEFVLFLCIIENENIGKPQQMTQNSESTNIHVKQAVACDAPFQSLTLALYL